ncbi:MAG: hypothetical protein JXR68_06740 [Bacteroidales bacterium]|nr:hypothetical protein [Bacteroidales bacterium]
MIKLPEITQKISSDWELTFYTKLHNSKTRNTDNQSIINEICLFVANNTDKISEATVIDFFKKIEKEFGIKELELLHTVNAYKSLKKSKQEKETPQSDKPNNLQKAVRYIRENYEMIHVNSVNNEIMYFDGDMPVNLDFETLFTELTLNGIAVNPKLLFNYFYSEKYTRRLNPILDYFTNFEKWQPGDIDFISEMLSFLKFPAKKYEFDIKKHYKEMFTKYMVRSIAGVINERAQPNKQILILKGLQNSRKTSFLRWFYSPFAAYTKESIELRAKENSTKKALIQNMFILNDEFDRMTSKELQEFKIITTLDNIKIRLANHYTERTYKRKCSFLSSTNEHKFLTDSTGNVRYIVIELVNDQFVPIPAELLNNKELAQRVWSQAYFYYKQSLNGFFDGNLSADELYLNDKINKQFYNYKSIEEAIIKIYPPAYNENFDLMNSTEFLKFIKKQKMIPQNLLTGISSRRIGRILTAAGYERTATHPDPDEPRKQVYKYKISI